MRSVKELMNMRGRVVLITGACGRLGAVFADALAELGASIVILDRDPQRCADLAANISKTHGVETLSLPIDLADEAAVTSVPATILKRFERLDVLINNAAFTGMSGLAGWVSPFIEQRADSWRNALEINLTVPFVLAQACAPALEASGHGAIINLISIYGMVGPDMRLYEQTPMGNPAAYAASKGGLLQLTRWLSTVLAPAIRVNSISPGGVFAQQPEAFHARYNERTPLKRMAVEEDLKGAAVYLASDLSSYVTGHNLVVDGGWTAW